MVKMKKKILMSIKGREHSTIIACAILVVCVAMLSPARAVENGGYPNAGFLVTTQWVQDHLNDPNVRIVDRQDVEPGENFMPRGTSRIPYG